MIHVLWISLLALLVISWLIFIRYYRTQVRRDSDTFKKIEEGRRSIADQAEDLNVFVDLLSNMHEYVSDNAGVEIKPTVYRLILDAACMILKCPAGSLMILAKEGDDLEVVCHKGYSENMMNTVRLQLGEGVAGRAAESGKVVVVDDLQTDARFVDKTKVEERLRSLVSTPLMVKRKMIGVLNVDSPEPHRNFGERELRLLSVFANLSAMALENLELHNDLQIFYQEMIQTVSETLDSRESKGSSSTPADHSRARRLAREIALELRLPESIIKYVEFACLMHGIGKIGIGETILRKPGKLTPDEYEQIKRHPEIAQQMISKVKFLTPVVPMILYHQERWDGSGYPAGLKGEEIPLGSRIVAVVNTFDAMTSFRPYRPAMNEAQATEEIKRGAGTQFDPKVVEAFVRVIERGGH